MKHVLTGLALVASMVTGQAAIAADLKMEIFVSEPQEINVTSPMIMGPTEMMVVSAQGTKSSATRLADEIESKNLELKYIFLTHPHLDHSQGASVLLKRFPNARFITTPEVAKFQHHRIPMDDALAVSRFKENAAVPSVEAEIFEGDELFIDGERIEIIKGLVGDVGVAEPDEPHVALHVPSLKALMPSDIIYFDAHVFLGGTTKESRAEWLKQIDGWLEQDFEIVVPGHMPKTSLPQLTAKGALTHSRAYIADYDRVIAESETPEALIEEMTKLYPEAQHLSALHLGAYINFKQLRKISFNPDETPFGEGMTEEEIQKADELRYEQLKKANMPHNH